MKNISLRHTIRGRLLLLAIGVELLMLSLLVANSTRLLHGAMTDQARWQVRQMMPVLNAALTAPLAQRDFATVQAVLDESRATEGIVYAAVTDREGHPVASSGWPSGQKLPEASRTLSHSNLSGLLRYDEIAVIELKGQRLGTLHLGLDLSRIAAARRTLVAQGIGIAVVELILSSLILIFIGFLLTRHLSSLTEASLQVASGNLTPPPLHEGKDDIGQLGAAFNTMSRALAERVNELIAAKENIEASETNFRTFFDSLDYFLFVLDMRGSILRVNQTVIRRLGYTEDELIGLDVLLLHPEGRREEAKYIVQGMLEEREYFCPVPLLCKDGSLIPVETRVVAGEWNGSPALFGITKDISRLQESEEKFSRAFNANPALMAISTLDTGIYLDVNDHFLTVLGFTREEVIGTASKDLNVFINYDKRAEMIAMLRDNGSVQEYQIEIRAKSGHVVHGLFSAEIIRLQDRDLLLTVVVDISKRIKIQNELLLAKEAAEASERALMESEKLLRGITDSAHDAILMLNPRGEISYWNPAAEQILGYRRDQAIGKNLHTLLAPERFIAGHCTAFREFVRTGQGAAVGKTLELAAIRSDGREIPISLSMSAVALEGEWHAVGILRDISEQKHAEAELLAAKEQAEASERDKSASEERIRLLLDSAAEAIYGIDLDGNCTFANPSCLKMLGYRDQQQLIGKNMHNLIHHSHPDGHPIPIEECCIYQAFYTGSGTHRDDEVLWRSDGTYFHAEYWSYPQIMDGVATGAVVTFYDISERRQARIQLEALNWSLKENTVMLEQEIAERQQAQERLADKQQQLEALNRELHRRVEETVAEVRQRDQMLISQGRQAAMGEMIGNIAHQWRQPLNALNMLIANIQLSYQENELTPDTMERSVATANRLIQKMSTTINDFRNFFRPDKEKVSFPALQQIKSSVELVESAFKSSNITIEVTPGDDSILYGFPNEYSQVLLNLLSNAREAIQSSGLPQGHIRISLLERDGMGVTLVRDNGGGITPETLDRIFEPYFSTKKMGTGIGLYMSKMIIERNMNGQISARNIEGGAEFEIRVPNENTPA